jgi:hypothetical protein
LSPKRDRYKALVLGSGGPHGGTINTADAVLAATLRDGATWVHFVAVDHRVYVEYTAASAV